MYLSSKDKEGIWHVIGGVGLVGAVFLGNYIGDHIELKKNNSQTTNSAAIVSEYHPSMPINSSSILSEYSPRTTGYGAAVVQREIIKQRIAKHSETGLVKRINGEKN